MKLNSFSNCFPSEADNFGKSNQSKPKYIRTELNNSTASFTVTINFSSSLSSLPFILLFCPFSFLHDYALGENK